MVMYRDLWATTDLATMGLAADDGDEKAIAQLTDWSGVAGFDPDSHKTWAAVAERLSEESRQETPRRTWRPLTPGQLPHDDPSFRPLSVKIYDRVAQWAHERAVFDFHAIETLGWGRNRSVQK